ncbi:UNVERIFIED_CONTAM: hypothetical protein FKN15_066359 [Acipenser sinensis]
MLKMTTPSDLKSPCVPRNGLVKLPAQPNGLGSASITKGTPAIKNRLCQSSSVPTILLPASLPCHMEPLPTAASLLAGDPDDGFPTSDEPPRRKLSKPSLERQLVLDEKVLNRLLWYFTTVEKCILAQVCKTWRKVLYQPKFWEGVTPILHAKELYSLLPGVEKQFVNLQAFALRGFHSFCLVGVSDLDICEFIDNYPLSKKGVSFNHIGKTTDGIKTFIHCNSRMGHVMYSVWFVRAVVTFSMERHTDAMLIAVTYHPVMLEQMQGLMHLELSGCNDFTEAGLWSSLNARLTSLSVSDCINVADDAIAAISQLLPNLSELSLQAYHVTDTAMAYFTAKQGYTTHTLRLHSCWEITNHGVVNMVHSLPNLTALSLSGCSKITDDGVELVAENLRKLRSLDLSWCPRITDMALEYIACDLHKLEELVLDSNLGYTTHTLRLHSCWEITNHGVVNMVHSLPNLTALSLSGCSKITDDGVELVAENLRKLRSLDLSWCPRITDMALEYIACDLHKLEELVLDRCVRITDTGLGYLSTMSSLCSLYLRWCCQVRRYAFSGDFTQPGLVQDFGLQHLFGMRSLRLLSVAGCPLLTTTGLSGLIQLQELEELELTNCPGATPELFKYYSQHLPRCMVIE